jgi:hypothetical protein
MSASLRICRACAYSVVSHIKKIWIVEMIHRIPRAVRVDDVSQGHRADDWFAEMASSFWKHSEVTSSRGPCYSRQGELIQVNSSALHIFPAAY